MQAIRRTSSRRTGSKDLRRRPRLEALEGRVAPAGVSWTSFNHDPHHTGLSDVASQSFDLIRWQMPVDLDPQFSGGELLTHYSSPLVTAANTVVMPVKTGKTNGYRVEAHSGVDGSLLWTQPTDYLLPPHGWIPVYPDGLTPSNRFYFAGAGGTLNFLDSPDAPGATTTGRLAFYGVGNYTHDLDSTVYVNTPITSDSAGDIFFGFQVTGSNSLNLKSGIARIGADGTGSWVAAGTAAGDGGITKVTMNAAPALSNDQSVVYVPVSTGSYGRGYLLGLDTTTLATVSKVALKDPKSGGDASLPDDGSASPMVGPDGDVYFGVLGGSGVDTHCRGWALHFSGNLQQTKIPGAFGWDNTLSVVPRDLVPSYLGTSAYVVFSKYNNYAECGGDGNNKIAILDPNAGMVDPITGATVMNEILLKPGPTKDPDFPGLPNAVREWCINAGAVDPFTKSAIANSSDGKVYRWDLTTNVLTQAMDLQPQTLESYTTTLVGTNGTVYAINRAILFGIQGPAGPVALALGPPSTPGSTGHVQVTFSEAIDPATFTPSDVVSLVGPQGPVAVTSVTPVDGTGNQTFEIDFPVQTALGVYTIVLGPDIRDAAGREMDQNANLIAGEIPGDEYVGKFTVVGPKVTASTPSTNVFAPVGSVRLTFNEPMDPATFTPADVFAFTGPGGAIPVAAVTPVAGSNNTQFTVTFGAQTATGVYQMLVGPWVYDFSGHPMDQNGNFAAGEIPGDLYYAKFGILGPKITGSSPSGSLFAPLDKVTVTFNESMDPATFTPAKVGRFVGPNGPIPVTGVTPVAGSNNTQFDITFPSQSAAGSYFMIVGPDVHDLFGNAMDQNGNLLPGEVPGDSYRLTFTLVPTTLGPDGFGHLATVNPFENLEIKNQPGTFTVLVSGNDVAVPVDLGTNSFTFYGTAYSGNNQLFVSSNGLITFGSGNSSSANSDLTTTPTQPAVAALWNDWTKSGNDSTGPMVLGKFEDPNGDGVPDRLILEWNQVHHTGYSQKLTFQAILSLNTGPAESDVVLNYPDLVTNDPWGEGNDSTVGIKDAGPQGANRLLVNYQGTSLFVGTGKAIRFYKPAGRAGQGAASLDGFLPPGAKFPGVVAAGSNAAEMQVATRIPQTADAPIKQVPVARTVVRLPSSPGGPAVENVWQDPVEGSDALT
jgi:hypothetical protein